MSETAELSARYLAIKRSIYLFIKKEENFFSTKKKKEIHLKIKKNTI